MAKKTFDKVMRHIRLVAAVHAYRGLPDRELLDRFTRMDDEAALEGAVNIEGFRLSSQKRWIKPAPADNK